MSEPVIALEGLEVCAPSGASIVEDVSLRLEPGEILGVVGESGSGKTTTALALFGLAQGGARLAHGTICLPGRPPLDLATSKELAELRGRYVAYVPQSPGTALNPFMRVGRALREMQEHRDDGRARSALAAERREVLEVVGLPGDGDFERRFPHQLSGGQQQRVCLAVALISGASTIVLDEPTTGLDVITQEAVLEELRRMRRDLGVSMVYISHDLAVVSDLASRIAVMYAGKIVEIGTRDEVILRPAHPYTRGLLNSTPDHRVLGRVRAMPGMAVALTQRTDESCSFAPRCPRAQADCRQVDPPLEPSSAAAGRQLRCLHPVHEPFVLDAREIERPPHALEGVALTVEGLDVEFRGGRGERVVAVGQVSLELGRGQCLAVVGESGSGKTTIARAVVGLQEPTRGTITLDGEPLAPRAADRTLEQRRRLQIVFQTAGLALNPREEVATSIERSARLCEPASRRPTPELMELVRLPESLARRLPRELSGGERQRILIARALATSPDVLVCDEITSSLDVSVQAAVLALVHDLRAQLGLSLLFITHDMGVVADLADQVLVLHQGVVAERGRSHDVLEAPKSEYARTLMAAAPSLSLQQ